MDASKKLLYFYWSFVAHIILTSAYGCYSRWRVQGKLFGKRSHLNWVSKERRDSTWKKKYITGDRKRGDPCNSCWAFPQQLRTGWGRSGEKVGLSLPWSLACLPYLSQYTVNSKGCACSQESMDPEMGVTWSLGINCWRLIHLHIWWVMLAIAWEPSWVYWPELLLRASLPGCFDVFTAW